MEWNPLINWKSVFKWEIPFTNWKSDLKMGFPISKRDPFHFKSFYFPFSPPGQMMSTSIPGHVFDMPFKF